MPRFVVENPGTLLEFLKKKLPGWKTPTIKQRLKNDLILRNGLPVRSGADRVAANDVIEVQASPPRPDAFLPAGLGEPPIPVLYADEHIIAVP